MVINFTYYNPTAPHAFKTSRNDKEQVTVYHCSNPENCDAYKRGKCVMLTGWYHSCPYGSRQTQVGYTKAARKCGQLTREAKTTYGNDKAYALKSLGFVCRIGEYVYLHLPYLSNYVNPIESVTLYGDSDMILERDFTPEFVAMLIQYRPQALMGGEIADYEEMYLPLFCVQLKRYMPAMYESVKAIYPEIDDYIQRLNYVGKYAKVKTLLPGDVKVGSSIMRWDGTVLIGTGKIADTFNLSDEVLTITPKDSTYVKIADNATVTDETEFRDE